MNYSFRVRSWDPTYSVDYNNDYYDNTLLPFNVRPVITLNHNTQVEKYIHKHVNNGYIQLHVSGTTLYDGMWDACSVYRNNNTYLIRINAKWIGYPINNGHVIMKL